MTADRSVGADTCELPPDLVHLIANVRHAAATLGQAGADYAYHLALLAQAATGRRIEHGHSAMEVCAAKVGIARRTLSDFALIAARWAPEELRALFARRNLRGRGITASQLVLIASLPRPAREHWAERAVSEELDVRRLRAVVREHRAARRGTKNGSAQGGSAR